jgi:hypothetical protein
MKKQDFPVFFRPTSTLKGISQTLVNLGQTLVNP